MRSAPPTGTLADTEGYRGRVTSYLHSIEPDHGPHHSAPCGFAYSFSIKPPFAKS